LDRGKKSRRYGTKAWGKGFGQATAERERERAGEKRLNQKVKCREKLLGAG